MKNIDAFLALAQAQTEEGKIKALLATGSAEACADEALRLLDYYLSTDEGELEPVSTAYNLIARVRALVKGQESI